MKPTKFKGSNVTYAENQPEYLPLPAWRDKDGRVISCWSLSWFERFKVLFLGKIWISMLTFNKPLQPISPSTDYPFERDKNAKANKTQNNYDI